MAPVSVSTRVKALVVTLSVGGVDHAYSLDDEDVQVVGGQMFVRLAKGRTAVRRMVAVQATADSRSDAMWVSCQTDVLEQIEDVRLSALYRRATGKDDDECGVPERTRHSNRCRFWHHKKNQRRIAAIPDIIAITTPIARSAYVITTPV